MTGAHGVFESYGDFSNITAASFLGAQGKKTPVFVRFSTVAGSRGMIVYGPPLAFEWR